MSNMELELWGEKYQLKIVQSRYANNNNLAIQLYCRNVEDDGSEWWKPFATLTTNVNENHEDEYLATIDTNNCPWAESLISKYCLGKATGRYEMSGFCTYPIYLMDKAALKCFEEQ